MIERQGGLNGCQGQAARKRQGQGERERPGARMRDKEAEVGARARCQGEAPDQITHCPETQGHKGSPRDTEERCVIRSDMCNSTLRFVFNIIYI